jgi:hypothetical protein
MTDAPPKAIKASIYTEGQDFAQNHDKGINVDLIKN